MPDESARMRRLRLRGLVDRNGELTARGESYAEDQYYGRDEPDDDRDEPEPYPDSNLY